MSIRLMDLPNILAMMQSSSNQEENYLTYDFCDF